MAFRFVKRPPSAPHQCRYLVFDHEGRLHLDLTHFAKAATESFSDSSVRAYLYALMPFFQWLQNASDPSHNQPYLEYLPNEVRDLVSRYLTSVLKCQIRTKNDVILVSLTHGARSRVSVFLSALSFFYTSMNRQGYYRHANPLICAIHAGNCKSEELSPNSTPQMPLISGVSSSKKITSSFQRLTHSYYLLINENWSPRLIEDINFPAIIFQAGKHCEWGKREFLVTRLLFETGARISEICGLTLGDWNSRGLRQEASIFSKGSHGRRVKFLRWSQATTKLLLQYFSEERRSQDPEKLDLTAILKKGKNNSDSLFKVPLFLTNQGTALSTGVFRDYYWRKACMSGNIKANIHQTRHWYVTNAIRQIYENHQTYVVIEQKLKELIIYMGWRSGKATLEVYQHYFDSQQHAEIQAQLHERLDLALHSASDEGCPIASPIATPSLLNESNPDSDLEFLYQLGGGIEQ